MLRRFEDIKKIALDDQEHILFASEAHWGLGFREGTDLPRSGWLARGVKCSLQRMF
jgi:hypothetical protein